MLTKFKPGGWKGGGSELSSRRGATLSNVEVYLHRCMLISIPNRPPALLLLPLNIWHLLRSLPSHNTVHNCCLLLSLSHTQVEALIYLCIKTYQVDDQGKSLNLCLCLFISGLYFSYIQVTLFLKLLD